MVGEVKLEVLNPSRRLIGSYTGAASMQKKSGIYNSYAEGNRIYYILTVRQAIEEAKNKMANDINRLNAELHK